MKQLRIALTGTSSVGKTTLAKALMLERRFAVLIKTLLPEGARELLSRYGHTNIDTLNRQELRNFQRQLLQWQKEAESRPESYLTDRSFVDTAAVWIERDAFDQPFQLRNEFVSPCLKLSKRYTVLIHLPTGAIPFIDDGLRSSDRSLDYRIGLRIQRYLDEWELPYITLRSTALSQRVAEVCAELERRDLMTPM